MPSNPLFYPQGLLSLLDNLQVPYQLHHHEPVFTVEQADAVSHHIPGLHVRNLFVRDKRENMALLTLPSDKPLDLKKFSELVGLGRLSFGSPERLWTYLGVKPGSVTPLAILNDVERQVTLYLDKDMVSADILNMHPLDNSMTISLTPKALMTILEKQDITPQIIEITSGLPTVKEI
jgi:Ala-tRNA(Pro) deacylase